MSNRVLLATASYEKLINLWDPGHQRICKTFQLEHQANHLAFTHSKIHLGAASNPDILIFDTNYSNELHSPISIFSGHKTNVSSIGFEKDDRWLFSGSEDRTVKIWDYQKAKGSQRNYAFPSEVSSVVLHPNQVDLICGQGDGSIYIVNLIADKVVDKLIPITDDRIIRSVSVSPNGNFVAAATESGNVDIWALSESGPAEMVVSLLASDTYVLKCLFSPNGARLATTSADSGVKLWNTKDWTFEKNLEGHKDWVWDCCYSEDSCYLLSGGSDKTALLWELEAGIAIKKYAGHNNTVSAVALADAIDNEELLKAKSQRAEIEIVQTVTKTGRVIKRAGPAASSSDLHRS